MKKNSIFHPNLHGYRQNRSTQSALIQMHDTWVKAASNGEVCGALFLDLSCAFDLVDHQILIKKLKIYGLDLAFQQWISSYLDDRKQAVWIINCFSPLLETKVGVPQGSNLGPLFFLIYYNDLLYSLDCDINAYADDSTLSHSDKSVEVVASCLTKNMEKVSKWMEGNRLKLNADKTHILTLGTGARLSSLSPVEVKIEHAQIKQTPEKSEQLLGILIDCDLKWHNAIHKVLSKLKVRLAALRKLGCFVPFKAFRSISDGLFNSVITYCLPLIGGCTKAEINSIQILQNKAAQLVTRSPPRSSRNPMFDRLQWLTVNQLLVYHTLLQVYRIRHSGEPEYLFHILGKSSRNGRISTPVPKLQLVRDSFTYRGAHWWNSLPSDVRNMKKVSGFKRAVKKWIIDRVPRFLE